MESDPAGYDKRRLPFIAAAQRNTYAALDSDAGRIPPSSDKSVVVPALPP
jgi:hypothetical protein